MEDDSLIDLIRKETEGFIDLIKQNLDRNGITATGASARSLHYTLKQASGRITVEILAKPFFAVVETGRRPTPDKKPGRAMIENIREWTLARGMEAGAEWAVAMSINNKGTELWRKGGRKDIFSDPGDEFISSLADKLAKIDADLIVKPTDL